MAKKDNTGLFILIGVIALLLFVSKSINLGGTQSVGGYDTPEGIAGAVKEAYDSGISVTKIDGTSFRQVVQDWMGGVVSDLELTVLYNNIMLTQTGSGAIVYREETSGIRHPLIKVDVNSDSVMKSLISRLGVTSTNWGTTCTDFIKGASVNGAPLAKVYTPDTSFSYNDGSPYDPKNPRPYDLSNPLNLNVPNPVGITGEIVSFGGLGYSQIGNQLGQLDLGVVNDASKTNNIIYVWCDIKYNYNTPDLSTVYVGDSSMFNTYISGKKDLSSLSTISYPFILGGSCSTTDGVSHCMMGGFFAASVSEDDVIINIDSPTTWCGTCGFTTCTEYLNYNPCGSGQDCSWELIDQAKNIWWNAPSVLLKIEDQTRLAKCVSGDKILITTTTRAYSLMQQNFGSGYTKSIFGCNK